MIDQLKKMTASIEADYFDIRYETKQVERVAMNKGEIRGCDANTGDGYVLRVLKNGALATVCFTKPEQAEQAIRKAIENAEVLAPNMTEPKQIASAPVVKATVKADLILDPRSIPIGEKLEITRHYSELLFAQPKVANVEIGYTDVIRNKFFINSEGSEINEELVTTRLSGLITAQEGNLTQPVRFAYGGSDGFQKVQNREAEAIDRARIAADLLDAEPVKAGSYKMILNPGMAGVFTHEAFGHFSEADIIRDLPALREKMKLGTRLGSEVLSITDDATLPNQLGRYTYDDEGVAVRRVNLMTRGVLTARLHDRFTAGEMNEPLSGHSIAEDFRYAPIVRMGNIFIQPDKYTLEELMAAMDFGLYIGDPMGGQTSGENFTFGANYGYIVKKGKFAGMIRDINIVGNLYKTLSSVWMIGNDFVLKESGGCGKGQTNIRSCYGGPHVLFSELTVGGK
ncbi:MAG: TldD/PmbA family protein [Candidatus Cloacimonadaceae bacterium]|nr:TldD/PmbA family protein [Candidatus Cloacimonadaceae bacterium]